MSNVTSLTQAFRRGDLVQVRMTEDEWVPAEVLRSDESGVRVRFAGKSIDTIRPKFIGHIRRA
jgi:hypothetical protein